ncbi:MAG TPA: class I SAM-dependent methyltransferase [Bacillota bacterium]
MGASVISPSVGAFLNFICKVHSSKTVLELGSSIGYSTLWFAKAVGNDGKVIYTDLSNKNANIARTALKLAGLENRVEFIIGNALEYMDRFRQEKIEYFDIIDWPP